MRFQLSAQRCDPSSCRSIVTVSPSTEYGRPPACQIIELTNPALPLSATMH